jgi:hypothetical protein
MSTASIASSTCASCASRNDGVRQTFGLPLGDHNQCRRKTRKLKQALNLGTSRAIFRGYADSN